MEIKNQDILDHAQQHGFLHLLTCFLQQLGASAAFAPLELHCCEHKTFLFFKMGACAPGRPTPMSVAWRKHTKDNLLSVGFSAKFTQHTSLELPAAWLDEHLASHLIDKGDGKFSRYFLFATCDEIETFFQQF